jgi:Protein of unknown function (DUF3341)
MSTALLAEFETADGLVHAIEEMRHKGLTDLDGYTPYHNHDVEHALGIKRSLISKAMFVVGMSASAGAYGLQYLLSAVDYPINVGGRPPHMGSAFVLVSFEMGVLFSALTAVIGVIVLSGLKLFDPVDEVPGFERATLDRWFLSIGTKNPDVDAHLDELEKELTSLGALKVSRPRRLE